MKINYHNVEFFDSCFNTKNIKADRRPEILFVGRSNVGKSSMINTLLNRKNFARVSETPGKTISINFYDLDKKIFLVDLPGYGFAQRSKKERASWGKLIGDYLEADRDIRIIVLLVDIRHDPSADDINMYEYLMEKEFLFCIAATKSDKLSKTERQKQCDKFSEMFGVKVIPFSSKTREGADEIRQIIEDVSDEVENADLLYFEEGDLKIIKKAEDN